LDCETSVSECKKFKLSQKDGGNLIDCSKRSSWVDYPSLVHLCILFFWSLTHWVCFWESKLAKQHLHMYLHIVIINV